MPINHHVQSNFTQYRSKELFRLLSSASFVVRLTSKRTYIIVRSYKLFRLIIGITSQSPYLYTFHMHYYGPYISLEHINFVNSIFYYNNFFLSPSTLVIISVSCFTCNMNMIGKKCIYYVIYYACVLRHLKINFSFEENVSSSCVSLWRVIRNITFLVDKVCCSPKKGEQNFLALVILGH